MVFLAYKWIRTVFVINQTMMVNSIFKTTTSEKNYQVSLDTTTEQIRNTSATISHVYQLYMYLAS